MLFFKKLGNFLISKRFIVNFLLIVLAWVAIIWGSITYFDSYTRFGEAIAVPNFIGNKINDLPRLINEEELKYEIIDSVYNPDLVEGTIIYQNPAPTDSSGISVKSGRLIKLRISKRSRLVTIPFVLSKSQRFAEALLGTQGLRTKLKYVPSTEDLGSVIRQRYKGKPVIEGQRVPINSVIELTIGRQSSGKMLKVPNLYGLTIKESEERLNGIEGLRLFTVCNDCETQQDSLIAKVAKQTPVAGDSNQVSEGSTITIFASPGKLEDR
jgi:beta-lactam-binding protein with PASTA domain